MTTLEQLKAAREFLSDKNNWTQGEMIERGRRCAVGALYLDVGAQGVLDDRAGGVDFWQATEATALLFEALPKTYIERHRGLSDMERDEAFDPVLQVELVTDYNDHRTHATVLKWYDRAIALAEARA